MYVESAGQACSPGLYVGLERQKVLRRRLWVNFVDEFETNSLPFVWTSGKKKTFFFARTGFVLVALVDVGDKRAGYVDSSCASLMAVETQFVVRAAAASKGCLASHSSSYIIRMTNISRSSWS